MGSALRIAIDLVAVSCAECGTVFGVSSALQDRLRETHRLFFCPNGHQQLYKHETEAEKLKKELAKEQQRRTMAENTAVAEAKRAKQAEDALARERKRVGNGVCPCCNRTFQNLQRHMATKHPEHKA